MESKGGFSKFLNYKREILGIFSRIIFEEIEHMYSKTERKDNYKNFEN
jgi:hypothetical protein